MAIPTKFAQQLKYNSMKQTVKTDDHADDPIIEEGATSYLDGILDTDIRDKIQEALDSCNSDMTLGMAFEKFEAALQSPYCLRAVKGSEQKLYFAINTLRKVAAQSRGVVSKQTIPISMMLRNVGVMERNFVNVTEATRSKDANAQIGIAGSWYKCAVCARKFDTAETGKKECPQCFSTNVHVLAKQAVPEGTRGIVNRPLMTEGDISQFNTRQAAAFVLNETTKEWELAFVKFTGKSRALLAKINLGKPFVLTVDAKPFTKPESGVKYYSTTGTSTVTGYSGDMPDITQAYIDNSEKLLSSINDVHDNDYTAMILTVLGEPYQGKAEGKWIVELNAPTDEDEASLNIDTKILYAYIQDERIARQLHEGDAGIFELRYTEQQVTQGDRIETQRLVNFDVTPSGVPIYLFDREQGTRFIFV